MRRVLFVCFILLAAGVPLDVTHAQTNTAPPTRPRIAVEKTLRKDDRETGEREDKVFDRGRWRSRSEIIREREKKARQKNSEPVKPSVPSPIAAAAVPNKMTSDTAKSSASSREDHSKQALRAKENEAKAYYNLGVKYGRSKRFAEAVEAFQQALRLSPNHADAYFGLGHAYFDLGRWKESVEAYEQVIRLNPKDDEAYSRLGEAYAKLRSQGGLSTQSLNEGAVGVKVSEMRTMPVTSSPNASLDRTAEAATVSSNAAIETNNSTMKGATPATGDLKSNEAAASNKTNNEAYLTATYRVGGGDVLDIRLLNAATNRSTLYTVTEGGLLDYPLVGEPLVVAGMTTDEIAARLTDEFKRRAVHDNPQVDVSVREYASHTIIVSGLVEDPGTKVLRREAIPLYVVIADAQPRPEAARVLILSHKTGQSTVVDLSDRVAMERLVYPGDIVTVQARQQQFFYIGGAVNAPGEKAFNPGITLTQAILAAGGLLHPIDKSAVKTWTRTVMTAGVLKPSEWSTAKIARQNANGLLSTFTFDLKEIMSGKAPDPRLQPGDRIEVVK